MSRENLLPSRSRAEFRQFSAHALDRALQPTFLFQSRTEKFFQNIRVYIIIAEVCAELALFLFSEYYTQLETN